MSPVAGPFFAAAGLLAAAGVAKLARPGAAAHALRTAGLPGSRAIGRSLGALELAVAAAAIGGGGRAAAVGVGACYLGFALFVVRLRHRAGDRASCGCFGADDSPTSPVHLAVNLGLVAVAALAFAWPSEGLARVMGHSPMAGIPFLGLTVVCAWLLLVLLTVVPDLQAAAADGRARPTRR